MNSVGNQLEDTAITSSEQQYTLQRMEHILLEGNSLHFCQLRDLH